MILYVAIGALFAFLGGMVYYSTLDFPELEKSELKLLSVDVVEIDSIENRIFLKVMFGITNSGEREQLLFQKFLLNFLLMDDH